MGSIHSLIRTNIRNLKPYSSARDEFTGDAAVFLDANENPYFSPLNRYPDPRQRKLKDIISGMKQVDAGNIFLGNGSDEAIDILIRAFCEPANENIVSIDPTYGMYQVTAAINNVDFRKVRLGDEFSLNTAAIRDACDKNTKIIFLCSPNNPTGNSFSYGDVDELLSWFSGLIVIDEAYIDFSQKPGFLGKPGNTQNLVVLQTLSKGWGRAGIRLGMAFACKEIIDVMNMVKPPYNINSLTIEEAERTLFNENEIREQLEKIISGREWLREKLSHCRTVEKIFPSDANFLLVKVSDANSLYNYLARRKIIVRNRSGVAGCESCLRISVGTETENEILINAIHDFGRE